MSLLWWSATAVAVFAFVVLAVRLLGRVSIARDSVLDEVRRTLRGGAVEQTPGRGPQARGRLGQLEITVDLHHDPRRPKQSPMWRVLAVGPVRLERPVEVRTIGWQGWIDPWMELSETRTFPLRGGPSLEVHSERPLTTEHPVLLALLRQSTALGTGALHARTDLMRAEARFHPRAEDNRGLFAWLQAMSDISESGSGQAHREGPARLARGARVRVFAPNQG